RPEDTVQWKFVARQVTPHGYVTPAQQPLHYRITDPQGAQVKEGNLTLNAFGSAWGELPLNAKMPLGQYTISFERAQSGERIGAATLFRLEEYKLPEFRVSVHTPEEQGKKKLFRLGDTLEAEIQAEYYFGGAVAGANVEVLVYQRSTQLIWW